MSPRLGYRRLALGRAMALALTTGACGGPASSEDPIISARDSAGVHIVSIPLAAWETAPRLSVDTATGTHLRSGPDGALLERPSSALLLADGGVATFDWGAMTIWRFAADGSPLPSIGRSGQGPGEFGRPRFLRRLNADTLFLWDPGNGRIHLYDGQARWIADREVSRLGLANLLRWIAADSFLVTRPAPPGETIPDGVTRFPLEVHLATPNGDMKVFALNGPPYFMRQTADGLMDMMDVPFGPWPEPAATRDGFLFPPAESPWVEFRGLDGRLTTRIDLPDFRRPVEPEEWEATVDARVANERPSAREKARELFNAMPRPERHPAYGRVLVGRDESLWIETAPDPRNPETDWMVLSPGLDAIARISIPRAWGPFDMGLDTMVVVRSVDDVPVIGVYPIRPANTGQP